MSFSAEARCLGLISRLFADFGHFAIFFVVVGRLNSRGRNFCCSDCGELWSFVALRSFKMSCTFVLLSQSDASISPTFSLNSLTFELM